MTGVTPSFEVRRYDGEATDHVHAHHQIVLPLNGRMEIEVEGRGGAVSAFARDPGASDPVAVMVAAGRSHAFASTPGNTFLVADLPTRPAADPHGRLWAALEADPFVVLDANLARLTGYIAAECQEFQPDGSEAALAGELLLGALERRLALQTASDPLLRAVAAIRARFAEPVTSAEVALAAGLSVSRLHAGFRDAFDTTPGQFLTDCRLREAARLLTGTDLSIARVAQAVGYGDQSTLTRAFRRTYGLAPARYRRESRHRN